MLDFSTHIPPSHLLLFILLSFLFCILLIYRYYYSRLNSIFHLLKSILIKCYPCFTLSYVPLILIVGTVGCGTPETGGNELPEVQVAAPGPQVNLGTIVCSDLTPIFHTFTLLNRSSESVAITDAQASTPCCSGFVDLPAKLPPKVATSVKVYIKPTNVDGRKALTFTLRTNLPKYSVVVVSYSSLTDGNSNHSASDQT